MARKIMTKRISDVVIALLAITLLSPVMCLVALLVAYKLGCPILFSQPRIGRNSKVIRVFKFRSMTNVLGPDGKLLPDDIRLTPFGKFLRRTSLDELPQLFSVLKGDLSLVGPRPLLVEYLPLYSPRQLRRHEVKPGITGWAQINGRNTISWEEKFELDVWYVENQSLALDLWILFKTVLKVVKASDIAQDGRATVDRFTGNDS